MAENRQYDNEFKVQAVKLAKEIGQAKAARAIAPLHGEQHKLFRCYGVVRGNREVIRPVPGMGIL